MKIAVRNVISPVLPFLLLAMPAAAKAAENVEDLKRRIAALEDVNGQLREENDELKKVLAGREKANAAVTTAEPAPQDDGGDDPDMTAIEQALTGRGITVLSPGRAVLEPGVAWGHSGADQSANDSYAGYLSGRVGLPFDAMVSVDIPYVIDAGRLADHESGFADPSIVLSKQILGPSDDLPTIVARLGYRAAIGDEDLSGFSNLRAGLSLSKNVDPVVFFGNVDVVFAQEKEIDGADVRPGVSYFAGGGASLAVTPEVSTTLSMSVGFLEDWTVEGDRVDDTGSTVGYLRNSWDFVISRHVDLSLSAAIGVTDESEDFAFSVGMPIKF